MWRLKGGQATAAVIISSAGTEVAPGGGAERTQPSETELETPLKDTTIKSIYFIIAILALLLIFDTLNRSLQPHSCCINKENGGKSDVTNNECAKVLSG